MKKRGGISAVMGVSGRIGFYILGDRFLDRLASAYNSDGTSWELSGGAGIWKTDLYKGPAPVIAAEADNFVKVYYAVYQVTVVVSY